MQSAHACVLCMHAHPRGPREGTPVPSITGCITMCIHGYPVVEEVLEDTNHHDMVVYTPVLGYLIGVYTMHSRVMRGATACVCACTCCESTTTRI